jgi:hypothetical protein
MAAPLFRPTIEEAFTRFMADQESHTTKTVREQWQDVLAYFRQYLEQEAPHGLPDSLKPRWEQAVRDGERFVRTFNTGQILPAVPGFIQDLMYQQSILPPGMITNTEKVLHRLGRWLLAQELASENDYLAAVQAMPHLADQLDPAEELSSRIFDLSRDDPPLGKVLDEIKGYVEIKKVHRGAISVMPIERNEIKPTVKVDPETSALARAGWWIDARLVQTPHGWQFVDVGNVLP